MATLTLNCDGGTCLSYHSPNSDLSYMSDLWTSCFFCETGENAERFKRDQGSPDRTSLWQDYSAALLSFPGNNVLTYKEVQRVTLTLDFSVFCYIQGSSYSGRLKNGNPYVPFVIYIAPYRSSAQLSNINLNNYRNSGTVGSYKIINVDSQIPSEVQSAQVSVDITDLHKSWFGGNSGKYIIAAGWINNGKNSFVTPDNCGYYYSEWENGELYSLRNRTVSKTTAKVVATYNDVAQPAPTPLYPVGITVNEADLINFMWQYNSATAATQKSATIQYKLASANEWTTVTSTGTATNKTVNVHLAQGSYQWRVAVTNIIDETSSYSATQTFDIIGKPAAPVINTPENKALTTITWNATGQDAFDLMFFDADGNLLDHVTESSATASYKPQMFLKGTYNVQVRIKNNADLWSDYAYYGFTITGTEPLEGMLSVTPLETDVELLWTVPEGTQGVIVRIEDGIETILTDTITRNAFIDKTVKGGKMYEYLLRTWADGYTDTAKKPAMCNYSGIILENEGEEIHLSVSEEKFLTHNGQISRNYSLDNFVGRDYPLIEKGQFLRNTLTKKFFVTPEELNKLEKITKDLSVYYRDDHNNAFKAAVTDLEFDRYNWSGYIVRFKLTRLSEDKVIFNV